jgi:hypothetical protein
MFCRECSQIVIIGTLCFDCAHICDFELNCANRIPYHMEILPHVFLPNSSLIASKMLNNFSFRCVDCNNAHMLPHEMDMSVFSHFLGVFEFPHLEDVPTNCMHIDLAYALYLIYLCCANGVVNKNGHVMDDMLLYHAQKYFAWSLVYEGTNAYLRMSLHEWLKPHTSNAQDITRRAHRHLAKVNPFYYTNHAIMFEHWLLFECCFAFVVSFVGFNRR